VKFKILYGAFIATVLTACGGGGGGSTPESLFHLEMYGLPTAKSAAVGFRCASYVWSN